MCSDKNTLSINILLLYVSSNLIKSCLIGSLHYWNVKLMTQLIDAQLNIGLAGVVLLQECATPSESD